MDNTARPRLADHVVVRGHWVEGTFSVVLHAAAGLAVLSLGKREYVLLEAADGTRDLEGIRIAAAGEGAVVEAEKAAAFFARLEEIGVVTMEARPPRGAAAGSPPPAPRDLAVQRIEALPGFALNCDGRGACCRSYTSIVFSPLEAARARVLCPDVLQGGEREDNVFFPERGGSRRGGLAVVQVDGACAYLGDGGLCRVHAAAGVAAKPLGCRTFPAVFVDDGASVRVAPSVECACILTSAFDEGGDPLLDPAIVTRGDLDPALHVDALPDPVLAAAGRREPLAALRAWTDVVATAPAPRDAAASLWALGAAVAARGFDLAAAADALSNPPPIEPGEIAVWIAALAVRVAERAHDLAGWRARSDHARTANALVASAAAEALDGGLAAALEPPVDTARETFTLRAWAFGHVFAKAPPVDVALRDHAVRLVVARALAARIARTPHPPSLSEPIAVVSMVVRAHGASEYALSLADSLEVIAP